MPAERAEKEIIKKLFDVVQQCPDWLTQTLQTARQQCEDATRQLPAQVEADQQHITRLRKQIENLVNVLADGQGDSSTIRAKLSQLESELAEREHRWQRNSVDVGKSISLPPDEWLLTEMPRLINELSLDFDQTALMLRSALSDIQFEGIVLPGKKRGFARLRFRIRAWSLMRHLLGAQIPSAIESSSNADGELSPMVTIDLGGPSAMDRWAPQIVQWRNEGVTWKEIAQRTGLNESNSFKAARRFLSARSAQAVAS